MFHVCFNVTVFAALAILAAIDFPNAAAIACTITPALALIHVITEIVAWAITATISCVVTVDNATAAAEALLMK